MVLTVFFLITCTTARVKMIGKFQDIYPVPIVTNEYIRINNIMHVLLLLGEKTLSRKYYLFTVERFFINNHEIN